MKTSTILTLSILGVIGLWLLFSVPVRVGTGKVGVVTKFGKVTGREMTEGVNFKAPFPFEDVWVVDTRVQKEEAEVSAASSDLQSVKANLAVNYHLERGQVSEIYRTIGPDYKKRIIDPAIQEAFKAVTARYTAQELITKRSEVKELARKLLEERFAPRGVAMDDVSIVNFEFSQEFDKAIESKQVAEQNAAKAKQDLERVKFEAQQDIERAKAEAESLRVQKDNISDQLLKLREIEVQSKLADKWNGQLPTTVLGNSVPLLNLEKK